MISVKLLRTASRKNLVNASDILVLVSQTYLQIISSNIITVSESIYYMVFIEYIYKWNIHISNCMI